MSLRFEWDRLKASRNLRKHHVSFDEASTVFYNPLARIFEDENHSDNEIRELIIGDSAASRLLIVSFTERQIESQPNLIRIISARQATTRERADYEENQRY
jgi:uncharacterized DUF497 family protein